MQLLRLGAFALVELRRVARSGWAAAARSRRAARARRRQCAPRRTHQDPGGLLRSACPGSGAQLPSSDVRRGGVCRPRPSSTTCSTSARCASATESKVAALRVEAAVDHFAAAGGWQIRRQALACRRLLADLRQARCAGRPLVRQIFVGLTTAVPGRAASCPVSSCAPHHRSGAAAQAITAAAVSMPPPAPSSTGRRSRDAPACRAGGCAMPPCSEVHQRRIQRIAGRAAPSAS